MFTETALYYDKIYSFKDYPAETERLMAIFREYQRSDGTHLFDVACGTGRLLEYLRDRNDVKGLDIAGHLSILDLHYIVGTPAGTEHCVEHHEMGLFTTENMHAALAAAGLEVTYDPQGSMGRGLFIGRLPG